MDQFFHQQILHIHALPCNTLFGIHITSLTRRRSNVHGKTNELVGNMLTRPFQMVSAAEHSLLGEIQGLPSTLPLIGPASSIDTRISSFILNCLELGMASQYTNPDNADSQLTPPGISNLSHLINSHPPKRPRITDPGRRAYFLSQVSSWPYRSAARSGPYGALIALPWNLQSRAAIKDGDVGIGNLLYPPFKFRAGATVRYSTACASSGRDSR